MNCLSGASRKKRSPWPRRFWSRAVASCLKGIALKLRDTIASRWVEALPGRKCSMKVAAFQAGIKRGSHNKRLQQPQGNVQINWRKKPMGDPAVAKDTKI